MFELVSSGDTLWASFLRHPFALSYIRLGAISPDFQWAISSLGFGHSLELSYFLLSRAIEEESPEHALFALGHLAHISSDASCETFLTPTIIGSVPLGMTDFIEGYDDALGESEGIVEGYGDLLLGDYDGIVDILYDFWFDGEEAKRRGREIFLWYCQTGSEFFHDQVDCNEALLEFEALLGRGEDFLGNLKRQEAKDLVHSLLSLPIESLMDLAMGGALSALIGDMAKPTPWAREEAQKVLQTALGDPIFWRSLYENHFEDLAPTWTLERARTQILSHWPERSNNAIICGNIQSVMQFLPDSYHIEPGLIVDGVWWEKEDGTRLNAVSIQDEGKRLFVRIRLFSALPYSGKIKVVVRLDKHGLDNSFDEVLGEKYVDVIFDPFSYVHTNRLEVLCPFIVKVSGAKGFYVEVFGVDKEKPLFTSSWDKLWQIDALNLFSPLYTNNFGTYGHWPPSLPIVDALEGFATLFVLVRSAKDGLPIENGWVQLEGEAFSRTKKNGVAILDLLVPGTKVMKVGAKNHAVREMVIHLSNNEERFVEVELEEIPFKSWDLETGEGAIQGHSAREVLEPPDIYSEVHTNPDAIAVDSTSNEAQIENQEALGEAVELSDLGDFASSGGNGGCSLQNEGRSFLFILSSLAIFYVFLSFTRGGRTPRS